MEKILIVDDEEKIRLAIKKYAQFEGYYVDEAANGQEAVEAVQKNEYDLVIMDIMMPVMDGMKAVENIREFSDVPIIMLSAKGEEYDRVMSFETGVDDYVMKPFSSKELMLRIKAILSRGKTKRIAGKHDTYNYEGLEVDFTARTVSVDGKNVPMTPKEYELLIYMIHNKGIALTRERLITEIWGYDYYGDDRTLDTHIKLLRGGLGKYRKIIVTLRGVGYRFDVQ